MNRAILAALSLVLLVSSSPAPANAEPKPPELVRIDHISLERATAVYRKLVSSDGTIEFDPKKRGLWISGESSAIGRFRGLLAWLDKPGFTEARIYVRPVVYRSAAELASLLNEVLSESKSGPVEYVPDERTGQLIVVTTPETYAKIDKLARRLDRPLGGRKPVIDVTPAPTGGLPDGVPQER